MRYCKYLLLPLAIACVNVANAGAKQVNIPFNNELINSSKHEGLSFNYDMGGNPAKKIVCEFSYAYKGWLEYRRKGEIVESAVYGDADGIDKITLTTKEYSGEDIYHADSKGMIKVNSVVHEKASRAAASCHYEADNS